jgi:hypothetical protein
MNKSETIGALTLALSKAQGEIKGALRDSNNPFFKSKYADLESVWEACRQPLSSNELAVIQLSDETDKGIIVDTVLSHSSGEWISGRMFIPIASKLDAQTVGSATTYARRYSLQMIVGIAPVDDDGNSASGKEDGKKDQKKDDKKPTPPPEVAKVATTDEEYHGRIKDGLNILFKDDRAAKLAKIEELTTFVPKGKTEAERVPGIKDYTKLTGQRLSILCHNIEKLLPPPCPKCKKQGFHAYSCPDNEPQQ